MKINVKSTEPLVIEIIGKLDTLVSDEFQEKAEKIIDENSGNIIFDCKDLKYISSSGLRALLLLARKAKASGNTISMRGVNASVSEAMEISGFDSFFNMEN